MTFIVFVMLGGLLALKRLWVISLHLPAAVWGAVVELQGWMCPLTPLEQHYRRLAGETGYSGGFIEHYLLPLIYPAALTRDVQIALALCVIMVNLAIYTIVVVNYRRKRSQQP